MPPHVIVGPFAAHSPGTIEHLHVAAGAIRVSFGNEIIALESGDSCSCFADAPHRFDNSDGAVEALICLNPKYRMSGLGRALMQQIESYGANAGRRLLTLDTATDIAENLYISLGYERAGHIPGYAREPNEDRFVGTTIMYKVLRVLDSPEAPPIAYRK